jgi:hypothetical protein
MEGFMLDHIMLKLSLTKFWDLVMNNFDKDQKVGFIFRVKFKDGGIKSYSFLQTIDKTLFNNLYESLKDFLDERSEDYNDDVIIELIFSYFLFSNKSVVKNKIIYKDKIEINSMQTNKKIDRRRKYFKFAGYNFPTTSDYYQWGSIIKEDKNSILIAKKGSHLTYLILKYDDRNEIILKNKNVELLKFIDRKIDNNLYYDLIRTFKHQEYYFNKGKLVVKQLTIKTPLISSTKKDKKLVNNFIVCDIETRNVNNKLTPICFSVYDGIKSNSFYLTDYKSSDEMLLTAIRSLLFTKYHGWNIYFHNFSLFDGVFILKILAEIPDSKLIPIKNKDGKLLYLKLIWNINSNNKYYINFKDSYLMLPESLRKLAHSFNVEEKGYFPFRFLNDPLNPLIYEGEIPDYKYYIDSNLTIDEYNTIKKSYVNKRWNLRKECVKYCEQDCTTLHQVISKFNSEIFNKYSINIHKYPTLPSLAFSIWQTHYLKDHKIPIILGEMYDFIKESYTGGHTDVYIPWGFNVLIYDVNSLYPYVMANLPMPVDNIKYFEGDITLIDPDAFGFFECEIITPKNLNRPLLQTKIKINNNNVTMAPLGKWKQIIFSEELNDYKKYGYKFKILRGYTFNKSNIFEDYVNDLYSIKKNSSKNSSWYLISKLLMNSLYGKFGMNPNLPSHLIIDQSELEFYQNNKDNIIIDVTPLSLNKVIISLFNDSLTHNFKVNISIASAITSYARIYMSKFLGDPNLNIYYTDTDSIDVDKPLDDKFIGNELGQFKLEYKFIEVVFLPPKVYGGSYLDGNNLREISKIKGYKNQVDLKFLRKLLIRNENLKLDNEKWFRNIYDGNIEIKKQIYNLAINNNKRKLKYLSNVFINTESYIINENKEIINKD